jgi:hypothetical protein
MVWLDEATDPFHTAPGAFHTKLEFHVNGCGMEMVFTGNDPILAMVIFAEYAYEGKNCDSGSEVLHVAGCLRLISLRWPIIMSLVKSKQRVADHGEVFTPAWMVEAMLDLVKGVIEEITSKVLEPACGDGNFLVAVLRRKLAAVDLKYGRSDFDRRYFSLLALMSIYGIELLSDNIDECRANLLDIFAECLQITPSDELYHAAFFVLSQNLIHGNAMTMRDNEGRPILFAEWSPLGKGKYNRRDFCMKNLTQMSSLRKVDSSKDYEGKQQSELFAEIASSDVFQPTPTIYPTMTIANLAAAAKEVSP